MNANFAYSHLGMFSNPVLHFTQELLALSLPNIPETKLEGPHSSKSQHFSDNRCYKYRSLTNCIYLLSATKYMTIKQNIISLSHCDCMKFIQCMIQSHLPAWVYFVAEELKVKHCLLNTHKQACLGPHMMLVRRTGVEVYLLIMQHRLRRSLR